MPNAKQAVVQHVLDVTADHALGKQLAKAFGGRTTRDAIVTLLGERIDPARVPAWITWNGGTVLDTVGHLGEPMFCATAADEDELYDEPGGVQLVMNHKGRGSRITKSGETSDVVLAAADVAKLTAYDGGGFVLAKVRWAGAAPKTVKDAQRFLAGAFAVASGDVTAYEPPSRETPAATVTPSISAVFLGDAARTGCVAAPAPAKAPKIAWSSTLQANSGSEYGGCPVVDETAGVIYAGDTSYNTRYSATRIADGKTVWKVALVKTRSWLVGSGVAAGGVIYQATNKNVFALDAKNGKRRWMATASAIAGSPLVVGDVLLVGSGDGVLALSLANGRKQWTFPVKRDEYKEGVRGGIAFYDGTIYFTANDKLYAVDFATRKAKWTTQSWSRATPSLDRTSVYTCSANGLAAIDRVTGKTRWAVKVGQSSSDWRNTFAVGEDVVVVRAGGRLIALAKTSGKKRWTVATAHPYSIGCASPIIAGGVALCVLVEDDDDRPILHAVDVATGRLLWKRSEFPLRKGETAKLSWHCTPAVDSKSIVYVQALGLHAMT